jgi:hypothetical protein
VSGPDGESAAEVPESAALGGEWLDGVEYDYVFDVKVSDGRVFKFGYNVGGIFSPDFFFLNCPA